MKQLILNDGTKINISLLEGIEKISTEITSIKDIKEIINLLTLENLSEIKIIYDSEDEDVWLNMSLINPNFIINLNDDKLELIFGLRKITEYELKDSAIRKALTYLTDEQAESVSILYPKWGNNTNYILGDTVLYNDQLYRCLQNHRSQPDWDPENSPSLWSKLLYDPSGEIKEWEQPDSTNPYMKGDKVTHNEKTWESLVDNNVWEPGAVGTESLWKEI